jgi:adenylate kinase family enzyme
VPRLIHVNGPPGIGKSTIARLFVDDHPGTLNLDMDHVRRLIGDWREDFLQAGELVPD